MGIFCDFDGEHVSFGASKGFVAPPALSVLGWGMPKAPTGNGANRRLVYKGPIEARCQAAGGAGTSDQLHLFRARATTNMEVRTNDGAVTLNEVTFFCLREGPSILPTILLGTEHNPPVDVADTVGYATQTRGVGAPTTTVNDPLLVGGRSSGVTYSQWELYWLWIYGRHLDDDEVLAHWEDFSTALNDLLLKCHLIDIDALNDLSGLHSDGVVGGSVTTVSDKIARLSLQPQIRTISIPMSFSLAQGQEQGYAPDVVHVEGFVTAGGQTITVGLVTETDSALPVSILKTMPVGLSSETDSALAVTRSKTVSAGLAAETDTAFAVSPLKTLAAGLAAETDTALAVTVGGEIIVVVGLATESDLALAVSRLKHGSLGLASEADQALAATPMKLVNLGLSAENAISFPVSRSKLKAVGLALEADSGVAITAAKTLTVGQALETNAVLALTIGKLRSLGLPLETDTAFPITILGITPDVPGLEYTAPVNRLHYTIPTALLHYTAAVNRLHYSAPDEDG